MLTVFAVICIALMALSLLLIILSLPGPWLIIGITALWAAFLDPGNSFGWPFFLLIIGLAAAGEAAEFFAGVYGAKKYGGTSKGSIGGIIGAIAGAILGAPLFFGLGALPGALMGCFAGCFIMEKACGADGQSASRAAWGATIGRFSGFIIKFSIGIGIIWLAVPRIWPGV